VFPGAACLVALIDRFTQHLHTVDIEGDSYRQKPSHASPPDIPPRPTSPPSTAGRVGHRPLKRRTP
jgi:hypothetical protein